MLPVDLVRPILAALPEVVGCKSVANPKNVPVVCKYAQALLSTCKAFYEEGKKVIVIDHFIRNVVARFIVDPEDVATTWKAVQGRAWLWDYIQTEQLDLVYQRILEIYQIALQVRKEVAGSYFLQESLQPSRGHDYLIGKELVLKMDRIPSELVTPFGNVFLFKQRRATLEIVDEVSKRFLQAIGAPSSEEKLYVITLTDVVPISEWKGAYTKKSSPPPETTAYLKYLWQMVETKGEGPKIEKVYIPSTPLFSAIENVSVWFSEITDQLAGQLGVYRIATFVDRQSAKLWCELAEVAAQEDSQKTWSWQEYNSDCGIGVYQGDEYFDLANLKAGFIKAIEAFQSNWVSANFEDHQNIYYKESEEEWNLYIKKEGFAWGEYLHDHMNEDHRNITSLAKALGLADSITCARSSKNFVVDRRYDLPYIYLWVRKDRLEVVKVAFGLQL